ncbi:ABC transporter ATP-binding protein [Corticibacter populi]|uniref:ABC transporter ATP-binding protein n=1 Tax=Corticibacter populi TaxID=1550736 RepID=A0A3M6QXG6_9BURK|nr:ABC transporter ATP-binding protein [Corticibacter populi]RMX07720.1 ABC transporter ATP-binding protein [Corticibacter populi]RZS30236.1 ATP-binding cassette subfamily B protein [Corticibacter populi]
MLPTLLRRFLRPYSALLLAVGLLQLLQSLASLYLPKLNADIIDRGVLTGDTGHIVTTGAVMLGVSLLQIAAAIAAVWFGAKVAMRLGRDLRAAVFAQVAQFSEREVQQFGAPSLLTRSTNDVQQVQMLVLMVCSMAFTSLFLAVGGVAMALSLDVALSRVMVLAVPVLLVVLGLIISRMLPLFERMQGQTDDLNRVLREQLSGIRVIRAFVTEDVETQRFAQANTAITETALGVGRLFALMFPVSMLILNLTSVAVVWFGASRIEAGMEVGALIAFLSYLVQLLMAILISTMLAFIAPRAAVSARRIGEVLNTSPSVRLDGTATTVPTPGLLEFCDVDFSYPGAERPVLQNIRFTAAPGTTTAIVGATGSGKTTLVNLAARLFDATAGSVRIGGVDVRTLHEDTLYAQLALVPQRPYLFSGTVASNLRYGDPQASDAQLWQALEIAQARDFVAQLPQGLQAPIAQGGTNVSGGQRQRLSIARAVVRRPRIYLFDDSFSALDTATDARLRQALASHSDGATRIVVAQRIASITSADQILLLEDGRISARGTHEELLHDCPAYAEIARSQMEQTPTENTPQEGRP